MCQKKLEPCIYIQHTVNSIWVIFTAFISFITFLDCYMHVALAQDEFMHVAPHASRPNQWLERGIMDFMEHNNDLLLI